MLFSRKKSKMRGSFWSPHRMYSVCTQQGGRREGGVFWVPGGMAQGSVWELLLPAAHPSPAMVRIVSTTTARFCSVTTPVNRTQVG
jgi:hypothetical protein